LTFLKSKILLVDFDVLEVGITRSLEIVEEVLGEGNHNAAWFDSSAQTKRFH